MAVKQKNKQKTSKLWEMITTEHKWENYFFLLISLASLVLGLLIYTDVLTIRRDFPILGENPELFTWTIIISSALGVLYTMYPFFKPAWPELKKVSWPNRWLFLGNTFRVFSFLITLSLVFLAYDVIIRRVLAMII